MSKNKERYLVTLSFVDFQPNTSGDVFNEGNWYFQINNHRFPAQGEFRLSKGEALKFANEPTVFHAMVTVHGDKDDTFDFKVLVKEKDVLLDDKFINDTDSIGLKPNFDSIREFKNSKVTLRLRAKVELKADW
eukprot:TRINITY_DN865_c0_g1_i1.p1 TRINITY_DN865_c0_g1~~TRINITY_DN865_c0_g1_i1.p1  ORF type:complete len:133 (+),score=24.88 TRINITY_DN865_c0_g1_i1:72-470(+)